MASGASEVSICNLALSRLGELPITSLADDVKAARECNRIYAITRDMELTAHNWNFAMKRGNLAEDGTEPDWHYGHRYALPDDCLRIIEVEGTEIWRIEGGNLGESGTVYLVTEYSGPVYVRYVARITDPAVFDTLFIDALAARLAMDLAVPLTQSNTLRQGASEMYDFAVARARSMDAIASGWRKRPESSWVSVRR